MVWIGLFFLLLFFLQWYEKNTREERLRKDVEALTSLMEPLDFRIKDTKIDTSDEDSLSIKALEAKGFLFLKSETNIAFVTSIFDNSYNKLTPIFSTIENFQETDNIVYQDYVDIGPASTGDGYQEWSRVAMIIPELIQPPYSGNRNITVVVRIIDTYNPPNITHGFCAKHSGVLWEKSLSFTHFFPEKGYEEASKDRDEALALTVKIGVAVAMSDGSLDNEEGNTLKEWVQRTIEPFHEDKQKKLKILFNDAMKEAYKDAKNHDLKIGSLTARLDKIGEKATKYEALELCHDVMAADGVMHKNEIKVIRYVAERLGLNIDEIDKMRDKKILSLDTDDSNHASVDVLLGIDSNWNKKEINSHLRKEFQKWNNRINTLDEGKERDNAQRMLDTIAEAKKNHG